MTATRVEVVGLGVSYGAERVVDDLHLAVRPGRLTALLGPSGCGKTTTLKVVAGLLDAAAGDVLFDGGSVLGLPAERRPASMVFQKPLLFPHLSVADNVGFGLRLRRSRREGSAARVAELLELVRLPGLGHRRVGELSGGQEQRVALARALAVDPAVLLLDEPFSQLDAVLRVEVRDLVRQVQRELGVTTLFVTHDQEEAVVMADDIGLLLDGRLEQHGTAAELYEQPASLRVARFLGGANTVAGTRVAGEFRCPLGTFDSTGPDGPAVLVVRQERLALAGDGAGVPGCVTDLAYLGTHLRAGVEVDGTRLVLTLPPGTPAAAGQRVAVRVPPAAVSVLPADGSRHHTGDS